MVKYDRQRNKSLIARFHWIEIKIFMKASETENRFEQLKSGLQEKASIDVITLLLRNGSSACCPDWWFDYDVPLVNAALVFNTFWSLHRITINVFAVQPCTKDPIEPIDQDCIRNCFLFFIGLLRSIIVCLPNHFCAAFSIANCDTSPVDVWHST